MIPIHGTPCGSLERNREILRGQHLCLSWTSYARRSKGRITGIPTASAMAHVEIAGDLLLDNGAFPIWRAQERYQAQLAKYNRQLLFWNENKDVQIWRGDQETGMSITAIPRKPDPSELPARRPPKMNVRAVVAWYRAIIAAKPGRVMVLIPDSITGGEKANDRLLDAFPIDLLPIAWPVWHTEESLDRFVRLAHRFGWVAIGAMGRQRNVCSAEYTARMIEVFNLREDLFPALPIHMLRGLQLAGGPFPFASGDSTDLGRNWSQTPQRLSFALDRWQRRARTTAKKWHRKQIDGLAIYQQVRQVTMMDFLARTP